MSTALITGANRGIGLAFARALSERGVDVIGTARNPNEATDLAEVAQVEALDVGDEASILALAERVRGPIDLLINNAGVLHRADLESETAESLMDSFRVNAVGPFLLTRALLTNLRAASDAKVVNITSRMGSIGDVPGGRVYGYRASKTALNMITANLAADLKPIPVVVLHPGMVKTKMVDYHGEISPEDAVERMMKIVDRIGPEESGKFYHRDDWELPW